VPLPLGTEVATRVDRAVGDRVITAGAVGRVVAVVDGGLEVELVGGGRARYARDELAPRKAGQVRYARRRDDAWQALAPTIVLDVVVGSRAWGLADPGSDEDHRGVFVAPLAWTTGLVDPPGDLATADATGAYWEVGKALRQAVRADPNTLEMLFVADADGGARSARRDGARGARRVRVAGDLRQLRPLRAVAARSPRAQPAAGRAPREVLGWLAADPDAHPRRGGGAAGRRRGGARRHPALAARRARDYVKQLYRSLYDQGQLPEATWAALVAPPRGPLALATARDLRPKNAYNLIRLLDVATRWLGPAPGEAPSLRVPDALAPTLRAIKRGEVPMADVLAMARAMTPALEAARATSRCRARPTWRGSRRRCARSATRSRAARWPRCRGRGARTRRRRRPRASTRRTRDHPPPLRRRHPAPGERRADLPGRARPRAPPPRRVPVGRACVRLPVARLRSRSQVRPRRADRELIG
jgi:hypothetical protein